MTISKAAKVPGIGTALRVMALASCLSGGTVEAGTCRGVPWHAGGGSLTAAGPGQRGVAV